MMAHWAFTNDNLLSYFVPQHSIYVICMHMINLGIEKKIQSVSFEVK